MITYSIEFALAQLLFYGLYQLLLKRETQLQFMRFYLLATTLVALVVPLVQIPLPAALNPLQVGTSLPITLPEITVSSVATGQSAPGLLFFYGIITLVTFFAALRFLRSLFWIYRAYRKSEPLQVGSRTIRHLDQLTSSFTFFNLIFIDKNRDLANHDIYIHEEAHRRYGHSFDLLLLNVLLIPFWWVPTLWLTIRELKQIHEYQADSYALETSSTNSYVKTLISHTLEQHGLMLVNSFNDTTLTKRLNFMKTMKKNINPIKRISLFLLTTVIVTAFSCQNMNTTDAVETITDDGQIFDDVTVKPVYAGDMTKFYTYIGDNLEYPKEAKEAKITGSVFISFVVNKDGSVSDAQVLRGIGYGCDEEALRVIKNSPAEWSPGMNNNSTVRTRLVIPIAFKL